MRKVGAVIAVCLIALSTFGQSTSKYQVATILQIEPHQQSDAASANVKTYDVTVRVGNTIYVALFTPHLGEDGAKYAAGIDLLVHVGKNSITYNDLLGRSYEVPIESERPVAAVDRER